MKVGLLMFQADYAIHPAELAREAEARGFESLFFPEHTHIPASRKSPWPGGAELPKEYSHTHDLFVALSFAAAATTKLVVGSGICLVIEHDPIILAKKVATLDALSNGRLIFGIGAGWNAEEMENHGTDFQTRFKRMRETIEAMRAIWRDDEASYAGDIVKFDRIWSWPKPTKKQGPPIVLGGHGPKVLERIARYGDGWMPIPGRGFDITVARQELDKAAEKAGRDPRSISISVFGVKADKAVLADYESKGVERAILGLPPAGRDKVLPILDGYAKLL